MKATVWVGHVLDQLAERPPESVQCVVTSPPYWGLRDYSIAPQLWADGWEGSFGLEPTPEMYIAHAVTIFRAVWRVLRNDGTLWLNMGDSYAASGRGGNPTADSSTLQGGLASQEASMIKRNLPTRFMNGSNGKIHTSGVPAPIGLKPKDLVGMPWRLAFALQADGWYLRQDIVWNKSNPMPESVGDRCTKAHEYIFLLSKSETYFFDAEAIKEKAAGTAHSRGDGVNPKSKKAGQHSRMGFDRDPRHVKNSDGPRKDRVRHAGNSIQSGLAKLSNHHRPKQNESFSAAVNDLVTHRNKRSVWTIATAPFKQAHFATFPPTLPRTCVKAGTSAKGRCSVCGRPLERIIERYDTGARQKVADGWDTDEGAHGTIHRNGRSQGERDVPVYATRTIGWEEGCCSLFGGHAEPCIVLDPFAGALTTALVSVEMGREFWGIELNPGYPELGRDRLGKHVLEVILSEPCSRNQGRACASQRLREAAHIQGTV
ncbi:MAG: site-specific DNA-methyltransferase [Terracidiphilus sp.]